MDLFLRYFLPIYLLAFFGVAFVWRSMLVWKQTGINPYRLGNSDTAYDFIGLLFRLTLAACAATVMLYAVLPAAYPLFAPIPWLQHPVLMYLGLALLVVAVIWGLVAPSQMGQAWRIGIDANQRTDLVESGLFRISRNPIFLGMRLILVGFFLILPNAATLTIWVLGDALMQIQARLEEEHLTRLHGDRYQAYCRRVRRWL